MKYVWFGVLLLLGQLVPELLFPPEGVTVEIGRFAAMAGTAVLAAVILYTWERRSLGHSLWPRRARAYETEA
ncbi:hypothetical protein SAMN04487820_11058 [Actinopolyspora mzabensis]|uniref:Uncharacterized protein n=1 Tax=Actinopolyspora mzabensis TaxID=995066 RepID=A0A1G9DFD3_ACTMZ|nr:hypothetical protein [Actinopolyspora mzabensis]SDK62595.1 hypothetical protein SAMN04487820_11058 [Actinopolyspora mzabensis]